MNVLFICSRNKLRSPTGEAVAIQLGLYADSAGLAKDAVCVLEPDQLRVADIIFVMEAAHKQKLAKGYSKHLANKRIIVLGIPDNYEFMDPDLVEIFHKKLTALLPTLKNQNIKKKKL